VRKPREIDEEVRRLAALDEPIRRRLFDHVRRSRTPVGREEAAEAVGIGRSLAAYHLDKLADEGLLATTYRRPEGRTGPGAGRPAKLYTAAESELSVSVPARDYEFVAHLLAEAAEADPSGTTRAGLQVVGSERGYAARSFSTLSRRAATSPSRTRRGSSGSGTARFIDSPPTTATSSAE
jgi:predicted ArsR family transcriptional regulator